MDLPPDLPRSILENLSSGVMVTDPTGRILWANQAFLRMTGYTAEEIAGQLPNLLKSGHYNAAFYRQMWDTILAGQVWQSEITNRRKDGRIYAEMQTITPLLDANGQVSYFISLNQEISEPRQAAELLLRQMDELTVLHTVATASAAVGSVEALIEGAVRVITERLYPGTDFGVGLVDETIGAFRAYLVSRGKSDQLTFPLDQGIPGRVLATGEPVRINDVQTEPGYIALYPEVRSEMCVPLKSGERTIGVLNAESTQPHAFDEADVRLMTTFAGQLAVAIERLNLYQQAMHTAERRAVLYRAAQEISASLDIEHVYQAIHRAVAQLMPCDDLVITLLDENAQEIEAAYVIEHGKRLPPARFAAGAGLSGHVIANQRSLKIDDFTSEAEHITSIPFALDQTQSGVVVPLMLKGSAIGALSAQSYAAYTYSDDDQEMLELLASHAAIALENARLFSEVQELATTDSLTSIFNRRHFFALARGEVERSRRYQYPLSLIMFDIDHFKQVNDTYGHATGDMILQMIARRCRQHLRETDIFGRYGGEEFVVLLPLTDLANARLVAERLRQEAAKVGKDAKVDGVTISLGVAAMDQHCKDPETLLDQADKALYAAKDSGRNRVEVFVKEQG
jgi:diguanylate cyclase (GGDEF)-like protein/PAS domain S-box-containing protein